MELSAHLQEIITSTSKDVQYIRKELEENKEQCKTQDKRLRKVEESQSFLAGKITILVMGLGVAMLIIANFIMKVLK